MRTLIVAGTAVLLTQLLVTPGLMAAPKQAATKVEFVFDQAKLDKYLETEFPAKVIAPAIERTLTVLFRSDEDLEEQAREAVGSALTVVANKSREHFADALEAVVSKDRAAAEAAIRKLVALVDAKGGYWDRAVDRFFPAVMARARPQVRVGVGRNYRCTSAFLGETQGLGAPGSKAAASAVRKAMNLEARTKACEVVRRWAETRALAEVTKLVEAMQQLEKGATVELSETGRAQAGRFKKMLERELVTLVGGYREMMGRIRQSTERLIEELPATPATPATPTTPAPPAEEKKPE